MPSEEKRGLKFRKYTAKCPHTGRGSGNVASTILLTRGDVPDAILVPFVAAHEVTARIALSLEDLTGGLQLIS